MSVVMALRSTFYVLLSPLDCSIAAKRQVERKGVEPSTSALRTPRSPN